MGYGLTRGVIDSTSFTPLSEDECDNLVCAVNNLRLILSIEEQLDLVMSNYLELENDLLSMSTRWMISIVPDYEYIARERNLIVNRRFFNLINACRGYLDHTGHHLHSVQVHRTDQTPNYLAELKMYTSDEYDTFLGYRAMEAMRNYTQHAGFPLAVTYGSAWIGEGDDSRLRFVASPYVEVKLLGKGFKSGVRKELERLGARVDVMPMVRQYVGSLGNIHEKLRTLLGSCVEDWETAVRGAIERFEKDHPDEKSIGLMAVKVSDDGTQEEKTWVFAEPIHYRRALERKNRNLGTLARRYVSSESR